MASSSSSTTPRLAMKQRASAAEALEYKTALQVLDEETMKKACSLLLSEADYQQGGNPNGSSDYEKLLAIFTKCNQAAKIVERHAPSTKPSDFPSLQNTTIAPPSTFAQTPRSAAAANMKKAAMHPPVPRRVSLAQMAARTGRMKRPALTRETSDSSAASSASTNSASKHNSNKKQRTSSSHNQQQSNDGEAPPQEALDFLQALNNQGGGGGGSKKNKKPSPSSNRSSTESAEAPNISSSSSSSGRSHGLSHPRAARAKAESSSQKKKLRNASSLESMR